MYPRIQRFAIGATLVLSLFGAANVVQASSLTQTQISAIVGLLQAFNADSSVIANVQTSLIGSSTLQSVNDFEWLHNNPCKAYSSLNFGDTDKTTGGMVTELQKYAGVSPVTGYYGPLTRIAYGNKCVGGNAQPTAVVGMSKYTDSDFGFSFWYPSSWHVNTVPVSDQEVSGGTIQKTILVSESGIDTPPATLATSAVTLNEFTSTSTSIALPGGGTCGYCVPVTYYFDLGSHVWMQHIYNTAPTPADVSNNTIGGLHMFDGNDKFSVAVPLSASRFVWVDGGYDGYYYYYNSELPLAQTIVATDPSVATPVSTAQQLQTIQAEASAYGVSGAQSSTDSSLQTYTNTQYGFSVQYPNSFTPGTTSSVPWWYNQTQQPLLSLVGADDAQRVNIGASANPTDVATCTTGTNYTIVTINGVPFHRYTSTDPALGQEGFSYVYTALKNATCYRISMGFVGTEVGYLSTQSEKDAELASEAAIFKKLDSVAQTFRFTN